MLIHYLDAFGHSSKSTIVYRIWMVQQSEYIDRGQCWLWYRQTV